MSDSETASIGPEDLPPEIDTSVSSVARGYDYALGGKNNFQVDRDAVDILKVKFPGVLAVAKANREFLRRGVRYLVAEAGMKQLIDVGSGLPTAGNVHEIAHRIDPGARVVYVDRDPIVLAHGRALLADNETTTVIQADINDPQGILDDPATRELIDFDQPVAVILSGILHHLTDEQDPAGVAHAFRDRLPAGSYMLISNFLNDDDPRAVELEAIVTAGFGTGRFRTWEEQLPFFDGLELVEPGFTYANDWRPDGHVDKDNPWHGFNCGGIGRKV